MPLCYSAKFVRSVSWRFTEQNRRGLTLFSINLIRFLKLHSAEEELEQKEKAYTRLSKCPVSELHYINCWQLWVTSEILQVENRGEGCLHRTDISLQTCTRLSFIRSQVYKCPWNGHVLEWLRVRVSFFALCWPWSSCLLLISPYLSRQYHATILKTWKFHGLSTGIDKQDGFLA